MPERVGGPIETGCLAVPHAEDAVVARAGKAGGELAPPRRGGPELLVQARDVEDVVLLADGAPAPELLIEPAERRALIAGDEGGGMEVATAVGTVLVERDAHERLQPGEKDAAVLQDVLVLERDLVALRPSRARTAAGGGRRPSRSVALAGDGRGHTGPSSSSADGKDTLPLVAGAKTLPRGFLLSTACYL